METPRVLNHQQLYRLPYTLFTEQITKGTSQLSRQVVYVIIVKILEGSILL